MKSINEGEAMAILDAYRNNIITVEFYKKDGSYRKITGRRGVKKELKGSTAKKPDQKFYTTFWEMSKEQYRMFDIRRVFGIRAGQELYMVRR